MQFRCKQEGMSCGSEAGEYEYASEAESANWKNTTKNEGGPERDAVRSRRRGGTPLNNDIAVVANAPHEYGRWRAGCVRVQDGFKGLQCPGQTVEMEAENAYLRVKV